MSRVALVAFALVALTAAGCRRHAGNAALATGSFEHGGLTRSYHLHLPPGRSKAKPAPLVLALHGGGGSGRQFDRSTNGQVLAEADRRGFIVVFPEGIEKGWNDGRAPVSSADRARASVDDVAFLKELVRRMVAEHAADPSRVYAMGISNGGFMAFRLAIESPETVAAIAPVTANLAKVHEHKTPKLPVPVMIVNGTLDPLVPWAGGQVKVFGQERGEVLSTPDTVTWWTKQDGCTGAAKTRSLPDLDPDDGARIEVEAHETCTDKSEVVLYRVVGGGHTWPGGMQYLPKSMIGGVCRDVNATKEIFEFFSRHVR